MKSKTVCGHVRLGQAHVRQDGIQVVHKVTHGDKGTVSVLKHWSYFQIAAWQAGFSCCHIECQSLIQMQLKIQTKLYIQMKLIMETENS